MSNQPNRRLQILLATGAALVLSVGLYFLKARPTQAGRPYSALEEEITRLGYSARPPLCPLRIPGTLFVGLAGDPPPVALVCPAENALGPDVLARCSAVEGLDLSVLARSEGTFSSQLGELFGSNLTDDVTVQVELKNLRALELPTASVVSLRSALDPDCKLAAELHVGFGDDLSMVTAVLLGDLRYTLNGETEVTASLTSQLAERLDAASSAEVTVEQDRTLVAEDMVIGLRDDARLAQFLVVGTTVNPGDLPETPQRTLPDRILPWAFEIEPGSLISHSVESLEGGSSKPDWAAAPAILAGWREGQRPDVDRVLKALPGDLGRGGEWKAEDLPVVERGLQLEEAREVQEFTADGLRSLLSQHGPLWITPEESAAPGQVLYGMFTDARNGEAVYLLMDPVSGERVLGRGAKFETGSQGEPGSLEGSGVRRRILHFE